MGKHLLCVRCNTDARRLLTEPPGTTATLHARATFSAGGDQQGEPERIRHHAWKAQVRSCRRFAHLQRRGVHVNKAYIATACELTGFIGRSLAWRPRQLRLNGRSGCRAMRYESSSEESSEKRSQGPLGELRCKTEDASRTDTCTAVTNPRMSVWSIVVAFRFVAIARYPEAKKDKPSRG
jgi:hypothetical protein